MVARDLQAPRRQPHAGFFSVALMAVLGLLVSPVLGQSPTQSLVRVTDETALIAQGWAALAAGDATTAAGRAQTVLERFPQSTGGLTLAVEASIARSGAMAGLGTYESWLGGRKLDSPYLVRRIALASLRESMKSSEARARIAALKALAGEQDQEALSLLAEASAKNQYGEIRALAELGDEPAVRSLIRQLEKAQAGKSVYIEALANSRSLLAVPALVKLLDDSDPMIKAASVDALGKIGATDQISRLRPLVELGQPGPVRWAAARALSLMGDAGGTMFLREMLTVRTDGSKDDDDMLQIQAAEGLAPLGPNPDWINTARRIAGSTNSQVRLYAAKVIASQDQPLAKDLLEGLLSDPNQNPAIRQEAADVLAAKVAGDFATLRRLLKSTDPYSQVLAATRIVNLTR